MKKTKYKTKTLTIRLSEITFKELQELAQELQLSQSDLIARLLLIYITKKENL